MKAMDGEFREAVQILQKEKEENTKKMLGMFEEELKSEMNRIFAPRSRSSANPAAEAKAKDKTGEINPDSFIEELVNEKGPSIR